jgi:signal recognition particle GTPase
MHDKINLKKLVGQELGLFQKFDKESELAHDLNKWRMVIESMTNEEKKAMLNEQVIKTV